MLGLLSPNGGASQIWTSPAIRARQTAELLRDALKERGINLKKAQDHESLWEQDINAFMDELTSSKADTIFVVCHAPFVEDLVQHLAGSTPPFSTGALACLSVDLIPERNTLTPQPKGRLLWFAQGPLSQDWKTLVDLQDALAKAADDVGLRRKAFFDKPKDSETMHKFRVSIRTLRSLIAFIRPWQQASQNSETQSLLREIVSHTSRLRELDVFEEQARANESSSPEFLDFCKQMASSERKRVKQAIGSKQLTKNLDQALDLTRSVAWKKDVVQNGLAQNVVRNKFDEMVSSIQADLVNLRLTDEELTHDVRKNAKRVRYAAERFGAVLGEDAVGIAKGMMAHQNNLGAVCDARVNIALAQEFLLLDLPDPVIWDLGLLRAQNETFLFRALKADQEENSE